MSPCLGVRERIAARRSRSSSPHVEPTSRVAPRPNSLVLQNSPPQQIAINSLSPAIIPDPSLQPGLATNTAPAVFSSAFQLALTNHINDLSPDEKKAFINGNHISIEALMDGIREFDAIHSKTSRTRRCAERVEKFLTILKGYVKGLTPLIQPAPEISSVVIGGVNLIIDLGLKFAAFFEKLTDMMRDLGEHLGYLSKYAEGFIDHREVQDALSRAYGDILKFCAEARKVFTDKHGNQSRWTSFRVFLRVTWEPFEARFDAINTLFLRHVEIAIRTAGIVEHERLRLKETLETRQNEDKERRALLRWLSRLEFEDDHDILFSKRHGDTGNWLLESQEFKDWLSGDESCTLWCHGSPGVGKSVLASLVVDKISTQYALDGRTGLAFVYYKYQNRDNQDFKNILSTLLKQLSRKKLVLPDHLKDFYRQYSRQDELPIQAKLQAQLVEISKSFDQVFIVIDALDECQDQHMFLPLITALAQDSSIKVKICVTSRREKYIRESFTKLDCPTLEIEARTVDLDIEVFVASEIDRRSKNYGYGTINQELKTKITTTLVSKSHGMFLWVKYQVIYIYDQPCTQDIEDALEVLPPDMESTYNRILEKIDSQGPIMKKLAKRALMWVVYAERPLSLKELVLAVAIENRVESATDVKSYQGIAVVEACANLVMVEDGIVVPVHYSVQEFLSASRSYTDVGPGRRTLMQEYQMFPPDAHAELAGFCIQYMLFKEFGLPPTPFTTTTGGSFTNYAESYWDYHTRAVEEWPDCLRDSFMKFLSAKNNLSFAYCNRMKMHVRRTITGLNVCLSFGLLQIFQKFHQTDRPIHDLQECSMALHYAARDGAVPAIQALLVLGFPIHRTDDNGAQPLYYACQENHGEAVKFLLEKGADINAQNRHGNALQVAALGGNKTIVGILLTNGGDINAQVGHYGSVLQAAASKGNEIVGFLLENGADINARGGYHGNAVQIAAASGNETLVGFLLGKGADINAQGGQYGNALQAAVCIGKKTMVKLLLEKGADINMQGGYYGTALQAAAAYSKDTMVELLLEKGADVDAQGGYYGTALQAAACTGKEKMVGLLLRKGADINAQGGQYGNALQAAACKGKETMVRFLLASGADINAQGGEYCNALQAAVSRDHRRIVDILLENGATDSNSQITGAFRVTSSARAAVVI